jgi:hypothetical protein
MCSVPLRRLASVAPHSDLRGNAGAQLILDVQESALDTLPGWHNAVAFSLVPLAGPAASVTRATLK